MAMLNNQMVWFMDISYRVEGASRTPELVEATNWVGPSRIVAEILWRFRFAIGNFLFLKSIDWHVLWWHIFRIVWDSPVVGAPLFSAIFLKHENLEPQMSPNGSINWSTSPKSARSNISTWGPLVHNPDPTRSWPMAMEIIGKLYTIYII